MNKKLIGFVILALIVGWVGGSWTSGSILGAGSPNRFPNGYIDDGFGYFVNGVEVIGSSKSITIGGGTKINKYVCGTSTWNPPSITSSTNSVATTTVTVAGAAIGDMVLVSFNSPTSTGLWRVTGKVTSASTTQIMLTSNSDSALDLSTSTAKACVIN